MHWSWQFSDMKAFLLLSLLRSVKKIMQTSILFSLPVHSTTPSFSHLLFLISWPSKFNTSWGYVGTLKAKGAWNEQGWSVGSAAVPLAISLRSVVDKMAELSSLGSRLAWSWMSLGEESECGHLPLSSGGHTVVTLKCQKGIWLSNYVS